MPGRLATRITAPKITLALTPAAALAPIQGNTAAAAPSRYPHPATENGMSIAARISGIKHFGKPDHRPGGPGREGEGGQVRRHDEGAQHDLQGRRAAPKPARFKGHDKALGHRREKPLGEPAPEERAHHNHQDDTEGRHPGAFLKRRPTREEKPQKQGRAQGDLAR